MDTPTVAGFDAIDRINRSCDCIALSSQPIAARVAALSRHSDAAANLFAGTPVFVSQRDRRQIDAVIEAIYALTALPGYREHIGQAPPRDRTRGILSGFDFHLSPQGPQLIEVNTNAGGAFIAQAMIGAHNRQLSAATELCASYPFGDDDGIARALRQMISSEWRAANRTTPTPAHIAIVDDDPSAQFLHCDMLLARDLLGRPGRVSIAAARDLRYRDGQLSHAGTRVDFVYNRLTDFDLTEADNQALRQAWLDDAVVLSPSPLHHRALADKRNLQVFANADLLRDLGLADEMIAALNAVPQALPLDADNEQELWRTRRQYYFKPAAGYGGKAVYRGSKITRRVWRDITAGSHIAQREVPPASRSRATDQQPHKFDIRAYAYDGRAIALVARLYQGQTTNFRTPGGGFAPVLVLPDWACGDAADCC